MMYMNMTGFFKIFDSELVEQLSWITSAEAMQIFLSPQYHKGMANLEMPTLGGKQLWDALWERDGWKVQKCHVMGLLVHHYRILDPNNIRKAWYLSRSAFLHDVTMFTNTIRQKLTMEDFRYGIVFSGGGGKGAYQIGVWKYLHEIGIDKKIHGVSGVSVGALNSLLFLQGDYQKAEKLWLEVKQEDFTFVSLLEYLKLLLNALKRGDISGIIGQVKETICQAIENQIGKIINDPEESQDISFSLFSQQKLREYIKKYINPDLVLKSLNDKIVYSMLCEAPLGLDLRSFYLKYPYPCCWNKRDFDNITDLVLTSAALPVVYPFRTFDGRVCMDGGSVDNIPIKPLMEDFHHIIVVHLQPKGREERESWIKSILGVKTADYDFYHVYPSSELHMSTHKDTATVNPSVTQYRMELGYNDAKEQLQPLVEYEKSRMPVPSKARVNTVLPAVRAIW